MFGGRAMVSHHGAPIPRKVSARGLSSGTVVVSLVSE
jgi:hypothetical protein